MRIFSILFLAVLINSCSTVRLVDTWENPYVSTYKPTKVLVVSMTPDKEERQQFEQKLKDECLARGIDAVMSLTLLDESFTSTKKTVSELKKMEQQLLELNFDSVLLSKTNRIVDKVSFAAAYRNIENMYRSFSDEYYMHQPIYDKTDSPEHYKVYHTDTSLYCICPTRDHKLIWKGYIDIVNPSIKDDVLGDHISLILKTLEKNDLIPEN